MRNEKTLQDVIDQLEVLIEHVQTEMCDDFCKYPEKCKSQKELSEVCKRCPLDRLR